MNAKRRKNLAEAVELISTAMSIVESVTEDERDAFDNLPEGLQESELGETLEENYQTLEEVVDDLQRLAETIEEL